MNWRHTGVERPVGSSFGPSKANRAAASAEVSPLAVETIESWLTIPEMPGPGETTGTTLTFDGLPALFDSGGLDTEEAGSGTIVVIRCGRPHLG
jgi:hypothetical protein